MGGVDLLANVDRAPTDRPVQSREPEGSSLGVRRCIACGGIHGPIVDSLGLSRIVEQTTFGPYRAAAEEFVAHHRSALAQQAGGELGPAPSTMVASAGLQLAASRWAFDRGAETSDPSLIKLGSQLANDSRQNLLAAYELATREAKARAEASDGGPMPWAGGDAQ
jgi:hypothetical protein